MWRHLKAAAAIYLQSGVAAPPEPAPAERTLRTLRSQIIGFQGEALLFRSEAIAGQADVVKAFNGARDEEYAEIIGKCTDFTAEIEDELAKRHLTHAELEENDEDLAKLKAWLEKVQARDVLGAARRVEAAAEVRACETALERFAHEVYEANEPG